MKIRILSTALIIGLGLLPVRAQAADEAVYFADGVKTGEVTTDSAILWTRLTRRPERVTNGAAFRRREDLPGYAVPANETFEARAIRISEPIPESVQLGGHQLDEMDGAVPGREGWVRARYWEEGQEPAAVTTPWVRTRAGEDCTAHFPLSGLKAGQRYLFRIEGRATDAETTGGHVDGSFRTVPLPDDPARVTLAVMTCQTYANRDDPVGGHKVYRVMEGVHPDFFVHTGDVEYYDKPTPLATSLALARFKWNRFYAMPFARSFHANVASYFMKDDHDTLRDDSYPGETYGDLTFEQGVELFREQTPLGTRTYRTIRWGKDLQVWLVEGREFRSRNDDPDGPEKTIWGKAQKEWFYRTVKASDATFRILISPTPLVGPDRPLKGDSHANQAFAHEGRELRQFIAAQPGMVVVNGDRHWQYVSVDPETGLQEFSCGPASDAHAGGFSEKERSPMHRYLRIKGGFLSVTVERVDGEPRAIFRHYGTDGKIYHEEILRPAAPAAKS